MENVLLIKSEEFAVRIINLYKYLAQNKSEYVLSKQLLRAGTSIGANLAEAQEAQSKRDFLAKVGISLKECSETNYWLRLLNKTEFLTTEEYESISTDCTELLRLLTAAVKTTRSRLNS